MIFILFDNSCSSFLFASGKDCFINIKSFILFDINLIFLLDFEIKLEKSSNESIPLFDEFTEIVISSLFGIRIPF